MLRTERARLRAGALGSLTAFLMTGAFAAELIYREDFNTDGEVASPPRYTTVGREVFEIDRKAELNDQTQEGPVYWARNTEVSIVGVPAPTAGRRMMFAWDPAIFTGEASDTVLALFENSVEWLLNNQAGATIVVSPGVFSIGVLAEHLTAAGYILIDDDPGVPEAQISTQGDLFIHATGTSSPSRGVNATIPVIAISSADLDDLLLSSIGTPVSFEAGKGTIAAPAHPAAGGLTGEFDVATGEHNWQLLGTQLPGDATVLANFVQQLAPSVTSLDDVDAMIAGTMQSTQVEETVAVLDFSDGSGGNWFDDNFIPGGVFENWGLRATGKINVEAAGTYTFALGTDDGGRLQIDLNGNGFDAADTIITDLGPHGHEVSYGNATFSAAGSYDIQVIAYNSGGGGSLEVSVSIAAGAGQTDLPLAPENWEVLGNPFPNSPVKAEGDFTVTSYVATGDVVEQTLPFIVLLNGPSDTPPGSVFGGGPFTGFEGTGFFAGSGLNKWDFPDEQQNRRLTLQPVDVSGKTDVQITMAVAATYLDFENNDYLDLYIDPDGDGPAEFQQLIHFTAPSANDKFFDDRATNPQNPTRLGLDFTDVTYDVPPGATDLVIEVRAFTSWWNEIVAFDNIRVTAGDGGGGDEPTLSIAREGPNAVITFANGTLQRTTSLSAPISWTDVTATDTYTVPPAEQGVGAYFRVIRQ